MHVSYKLIKDCMQFNNEIMMPCQDAAHVLWPLLNILRLHGLVCLAGGGIMHVDSEKRTRASFWVAWPDLDAGRVDFNNFSEEILSILTFVFNFP